MRHAFIIILLFGLCACSNVNSPPFKQGGARIVYISPVGEDTNYGTPDGPMKTLSAVCAKLKREAPDTNVEVRCLSASGTYFDQFVTWDYWNPRRMTTIRSWPPGSHARFEMSAAAGSDSPFFTLAAKSGEPTNLRIDGLLVIGYDAGAILFLGTWPGETPAKWNGYNKVSNCIFGQIGNLNRPELLSADAVLNFVYSVCDTVENCIFYRCANNAVTGVQLNGVYMKHSSRGNVIRSNLFRGLSGNSIKIRNGANANIIEDNTFIRSGEQADVVSKYCDESLWDEPWTCYDTYGAIPEGASDSTIIRNNVARGSSSCDLAIIWTDLMLTLPPCSKCNPCRGDTSHVTLSGNSCDTCQVSDYWINDVPPY